MSSQSNVGRGEWPLGYRIKHRFYVIDADTGLPLDMSAMSLTYRLRLTVDGAALVTKTLASGQIVVSNGNGTGDLATVTIEAVDTSGLAEGWYVDALVRTDTAELLGWGQVYLFKVA